MGLELLGLSDNRELVRYVAKAVLDRDEQYRREKIRQRVRLYRDDYQDILRVHIAAIFNEPAVRQRLEGLIPLVGGSSLIKRIADELARPLYARTPIRRVLTDGDLAPSSVEEAKRGAPSPAQQAWNGLIREMDLDDRMDLVARLLTPCNTVSLFARYVDGVGMTLDVITPDMRTVIPDPRIPTRPLAIVYDSAFDQDGKPIKYVCWDDKRYFSFSPDEVLIEGPTVHDYGLIPIIEVHRHGRWGDYDDATTGEDLVSASIFSMIMDLIVAKKLKTQSHIQLAFQGDTDGLSKDQITDEESILTIHGAGTLFPINLESDPSVILKAKETVETMVAASYGISRDRLNQKTGDVGEDVGLKERVSEMARVLHKAEQDIFRVTKAISREHPEYRGKIPDDATLVVDLGQVHNRVDRKTQLEVRETEKHHGIRSSVDDVLEDNPEFGGDRVLALAYLEEKASEQAIVVARQRALNMPKDANIEEPGQDAEANGAMGPKVRDGFLSRDKAADAAKTGGTAADNQTQGE